ncbi:MAG: cupin domain-containing protein [Actinomycetota bacterium]|nr:cupin domain-containing protein [Actinomycetota bacterium]
MVRADALFACIYKLAAGATDPQVPHLEDEVYVVVAGICAIEIDGRRETVSAGSLVYVPGRTAPIRGHRRGSGGRRRLRAA